MYCLNAAINTKSSYTIGDAGVSKSAQLFAKSCDGSKATLRPNHRNIWTCDDCKTIRSIQGTEICQVIKTCAFKITKAVEFTKKSEITLSELCEREGFKKSSDNTYSAAGLDLKRLVGLHVQFYYSIAKEISLS